MLQAREKTCGRSSRQAGGLAASTAAVMLAMGLGAGTAAAGGAITVEKPWMRFIIKARPASGYFTLRNNGDAAVELTGASSSACGMLMLHQSKQEKGVDRMMHMKSVSVPAHGTLVFAPGGYHLMCMSPTNGMAIGANVQVTLRFADGTQVTSPFPVKGPSGK